MKKPLFTVVFLLCVFLKLSANQQISVPLSGYTLTWNLDVDFASIVKNKSTDTIWKGSIMPALWVQDGNKKIYLKAKYKILSKNEIDSSGVINVSFGSAGKGTIQYSYKKNVFHFSTITIEWVGKPLPVIALYFGTSMLTDRQRLVVSSLNEPFWPDWQAEGYCIPAAKGAPMQSFFRSWQFGNASIPLGSFGESMGTPYAAAFPRPLFSMSMGGKSGWAVMGTGVIPDAAMTTKIKASTGCIEYLYREDLWGPTLSSKREWKVPLMITAAPQAWDAYHQLFSYISNPQKGSSSHQLNHWNTWGDFMNKDFELSGIILRAKEFKAEEITLDMGWETFESSGIPDQKKFPNFDKDVKKIHEAGIKLGFWQSVLWVKDYHAAGLTEKDLIAGIDGKPRLVNWLMSPYSDQMYYALDPSSPNARRFLTERTQKIIKKYKADLLKLDFGYDIPSPDIAVPRDPSLRGEKYAYTLLKIIADAAKEINPDITIQYYSINPLFNDVQNLLALDDMGDAGNDETGCHGQWSIWAALAGMQGMAIMASSGYNWDNDIDILLNTAVIGSPGLVLPRTYNGSDIPTAMLHKRLALALWYRRTTGWTPLWLNSEKGNLSGESRTYCFGRLEMFEGKEKLTSLALREEKKESLSSNELKEIEFKGTWTLISQDHNDLFESTKLACIPFGAGKLQIQLKKQPGKIHTVYPDRVVDYTDWRYKDGKIIIQVDKALSESILGILIE